MGTSDFNASHTTGHIYTFRLKPNEDLKLSLHQFAIQNNIQAAIMLTCVGSLQHYNLRFASQAQGNSGSGHFEIVSLVGTFSYSSLHLHLCISDSKGQTIGGHLLDQNLIYTTAEIAVAELPHLIFDRDLDASTGYRELVIRPRNIHEK